MTTGIAIEWVRVEDAVAVAAFPTLAWQQTYRGLIDGAVLVHPTPNAATRAG